MPSPTIDTLLPAVTPLRPAEPPVREAAAETFAPTLRDAVEARGPRPETAPPKTASDQQDAPDQQSRDEDLVDSDAAPEVAAATEQETSEGEEDAAADEVEISEVSEVAANVAAAQHQQVILSGEQHEIVPIAVEAINAEDAGDNRGEGEAELEAQADAIDGEAGVAVEKAAPPSAAADAPRTAAAVRVGAEAPFRGKEMPRGVAAAEVSVAPTAAPTAAAPKEENEKQTHAPATEVHASPGGGESSTSDDKLRATSHGERSGQNDSRSVESNRDTPNQPAGPGRADAVIASVELAASSTEASPSTAAPDTAPVDAPVKPAEAATTGAVSSRAATPLDRLAAGVGHSAAASPEQEAAPPADRLRFMHRVEGAVRRAQERDGRVQVRLSPPELGSLRIELALQNGVLTAKIEAETPMARNLLLDSLPALRERLAQQDIRVEKFDVDLRQDTGGKSGSDDRSADQPWTRRGDQRGREAPPAPRTAAAAAVRPSASSSPADSGLDVRV